ncbi:glycoside hydrolase family 25 protein [Aminobacter niigataensis]|uniref:glycoside hydrolase family 25 protein n=1 Tax=Aminobacter niigataensis TaxID=83265 RepID=UPI0024C6195F|nr:GH25 family lysozyme [Aminobacter niigataensis]CAI2932733.1 Lysozyme M1 [Aminobacter niigataensis]
MRFSAASAIVLASLALAGCTSSMGLSDIMSSGPSKETTASVARPASPVPQADIAAAAPSMPVQQAMSAPMPQAGILVAPPMPAAMMTEEPVQVAMAAPRIELDGIPTPDTKPIALIAPSNPMKATPFAPGQIYGRRFRDAKPINFGKAASPRNFAVHGVDVSRWQGEIDWPKLRTQGANFAYIKATDGGDHLDPMFRKNWRAAEAAGLRRGAYHFFYWCRTAGEQADWFIRNVPKVAGALPPVIDVEYNGESSCKRRLSRAKTLEKMQVFMDKLERHYGQRPIIYTAPDFYRDNLRGEFLDYPFWLRAVAEPPSKVYPGRKWVFWQYSGSGLSHGVEGKIDLNVFRGSASDWHRWVANSAG